MVMSVKSGLNYHYAIGWYLNTKIIICIGLNVAFSKKEKFHPILVTYDFMALKIGLVFVLLNELWYNVAHNWINSDMNNFWYKLWIQDETPFLCVAYFHLLKKNLNPLERQADPIYHCVLLKENCKDHYYIRFY